ncbi:MAG: glycosyltransferase [Fibrobacter sp.]|nr:glycosyltransferase [Fibrobacter sp.]
MFSASSYDIVILGLTITSSWGNGHATTYRGLVKELSARGHKVLFLERDMPWYAMHRDLNESSCGRTELYSSMMELKDRFTGVIQSAELVIVGSFVPDGVAVGEWVTHTAHGITAFYDIDTPVTLAKLLRRECDYLTAGLISRYDLYLSFAGGPILKVLEQLYGSPLARPFYCSVDPANYYPEDGGIKYDLGYMGTFSEDRQGPFDELLLKPALKWPEGKFIVAGPKYPDISTWPGNVIHREHVPPSMHREFYCSQRFTLNLTRSDMVQSGFAPSVRLFEAAACGTPIISDYWEGLNEIFTFGEEILIASSQDHILKYLSEISETERNEIAAKARKRVLSAHTAARRALELENYAAEAGKKRRETSLVRPKLYRRA